MDVLCAFIIGYGASIAILLGTGLMLHFRRKRGKLSRALLVSATLGIVVPLTIYLSYPYVVPMPVPEPPQQAASNTSLIGQVFSKIIPQMLSAVFYELARVIDSFGYGTLSVIGAFLLSFLVPYRCRAKETAV